MKRSRGSSRCCSCTSCIFKSESEKPSVQEIIDHGSRIDRLYLGKFIPLRERNLLGKLLQTRAVYDEAKSDFYSDADDNQNLRTKKLQDSKKKDNVNLEIIDLIDKDPIFKKSSECCSCCSCSGSYLDEKHHRRGRHGRSKHHLSRASKLRHKLRLKKHYHSKTGMENSAPCKCSFEGCEDLIRVLETSYKRSHGSIRPSKKKHPKRSKNRRDEGAIMSLSTSSTEVQTQQMQNAAKVGTKRKKEHLKHKSMGIVKPKLSVSVGLRKKKGVSEKEGIPLYKSKSVMKMSKSTLNKKIQEKRKKKLRAKHSQAGDQGGGRLSVKLNAKPTKQSLSKGSSTSNRSIDKWSGVSHKGRSKKEQAKTKTHQIKQQASIRGPERCFCTIQLKAKPTKELLPKASMTTHNVVDKAQVKEQSSSTENRGSSHEKGLQKTTKTRNEETNIHSLSQFRKTRSASSLAFKNMATTEAKRVQSTIVPKQHPSLELKPKDDTERVYKAPKDSETLYNTDSRNTGQNVDEELLTKKAKKSQLKSKPSQFRVMKQENRGSQGDMRGQQILTTTQVEKPNKNNMRIGSALKRCLCILKLNKTSRGTKTREDYSKGTETPSINASSSNTINKGTKTKQRKHRVEGSYQGVRRKETGTFAERPKANVVSSMTRASSVSSGAVMKNKKHRVQATRAKHYKTSPHRIMETSEFRRPSRQAVKITSSFSFDIEFYKECAPSRNLQKERCLSFMKNSSDLRSSSSRNTRGEGAIRSHRPMLKRCFCTLQLHESKDMQRGIKTGLKPPGVYTVSRVTIAKSVGKPTIFHEYDSNILQTDTGSSAKYDLINYQIASSSSLGEIRLNPRRNISPFKSISNCTHSKPSLQLLRIRSDFSSQLNYLTTDEIPYGNMNLNTNFNVAPSQLVAGNNPFSRQYFYTMNVEKVNHALDPNECEPNICKPSVCDPYECQKLIHKRLGISSTAKGTHPERDSKQKGTPALRYENKHRYVSPGEREGFAYENYAPPHIRKPRDKKRQAVRLDSHFKFNVEFYKDQPKKRREKRYSSRYDSETPVRPDKQVKAVAATATDKGDLEKTEPEKKEPEKGEEAKPESKADKKNKKVKCVCTPKGKEKKTEAKEKKSGSKVTCKCTPKKPKKKKKGKGDAGETPETGSGPDSGSGASGKKSKKGKKGKLICKCTDKSSKKGEAKKGDAKKGDAKSGKKSKSSVTCKCVKGKKKKGDATPQEDEKCRCTAKLEGQPQKTTTGQNTKSPKLQKVLDLQSCEPYICIPDICSPKECLEKARKNARLRERASNTNITLPQKHEKSILQDIVGKPVKIRRPEFGYVGDMDRTSKAALNRQAVKIGSTFSVNIEFYKDRTPRDLELQGAARKLKYPDRRSKGICTGDDVDFLRDSCVQTWSSGGCLCSLKLKMLGQKYDGIRYKHQETRTDSQLSEPDMHTRGIGTRRRRFRPFECAPDACVPRPGECDPWVCRKQPNKKYLRECGTSTKKLRTRTKASLSNASGFRNRFSGYYRDSVEYAQRKFKQWMQQVNPEMEQAVRIGSDFRFSVEFYKDQTVPPDVRKKSRPFTLNKAPRRKKTADEDGAEKPKFFDNEAQAGGIGYRKEGFSNTEGGGPKKCFCLKNLKPEEIPVYRVTNVPGFNQNYRKDIQQTLSRTQYRNIGDESTITLSTEIGTAKTNKNNRPIESSDDFVDNSISQSSKHHSSKESQIFIKSIRSSIIAINPLLKKCLYVLKNHTNNTSTDRSQITKPEVKIIYPPKNDSNKIISQFNETKEFSKYDVLQNIVEDTSDQCVSKQKFYDTEQTCKWVKSKHLESRDTKRSLDRIVRAIFSLTKDTRQRNYKSHTASESKCISSSSTNRRHIRGFQHRSGIVEASNLKDQSNYHSRISDDVDFEKIYDYKMHKKLSNKRSGIGAMLKKILKFPFKMLKSGQNERKKTKIKVTPKAFDRTLCIKNGNIMNQVDHRNFKKSRKLVQLTGLQSDAFSTQGAHTVQRRIKKFHFEKIHKQSVKHISNISINNICSSRIVSPFKMYHERHLENKSRINKVLKKKEYEKTNPTTRIVKYLAQQNSRQELCPLPCSTLKLKEGDILPKLHKVFSKSKRKPGTSNVKPSPYYQVSTVARLAIEDKINRDFHNRKIKISPTVNNYRSQKFVYNSHLKRRSKEILTIFPYMPKNRTSNLNTQNFVKNRNESDTDQRKTMGRGWNENHLKKLRPYKDTEVYKNLSLKENRITNNKKIEPSNSRTTYLKNAIRRLMTFFKKSSNAEKILVIKNTTYNSRVTKNNKINKVRNLRKKKTSDVLRISKSDRRATPSRSITMPKKSKRVKVTKIPETVKYHKSHRIFANDDKFVKYFRYQSGDTGGNVIKHMYNYKNPEPSSYKHNPLIYMNTQQQYCKDKPFQYTKSPYMDHKVVQFAKCLKECKGKCAPMKSCPYTLPLSQTPVLLADGRTKSQCEREAAAKGNKARKSKGGKQKSGGDQKSGADQKSGEEQKSGGQEPEKDTDDDVAPKGYRFGRKKGRGEKLEGAKPKPKFEMKLTTDNMTIINLREVYNKIQKYKTKEEEEYGTYDGEEIGGKAGKKKKKKQKTKHKDSCVCCKCIQTADSVSKDPMFFRRPPCICKDEVCDRKAQKVYDKKIKDLERKKLKRRPCICGAPSCITQKFIQEDKERKMREEAELRKLKYEEFKQFVAEERDEKKQTAFEILNQQKYHKKKKKFIAKDLDNETPDVLLMGGAVADIGVSSVKGLLKGTKYLASRVIHPEKSYRYYKYTYFKDPNFPKRAKEAFSDTLKTSGLGLAGQRAKARLANMATSKAVASKIKDRKKRKVPKRIPVDFNCKLYPISLRRKPYLILYKCCPWFYPHCISFLNVCQQCMNVLLFCLAVIVWSPCIICVETCRTLVCCSLCTA